MKDVPSDVSMNEEVDYFLRQLVGNETPLTCVYEGDPFKDGVYLTMPTNESVNDKINMLLIPTWKRDNYDDGNYETCLESNTLFFIQNYMKVFNISFCYLMPFFIMILIPLSKNII